MCVNVRMGEREKVTVDEEDAVDVEDGIRGIRIRDEGKKKKIPRF